MLRVPSIVLGANRVWRERRVRTLRREIARLRRLNGPVLRRDLAEGAVVVVAVLVGLGVLVEAAAAPWPLFAAALALFAWLLWRAGRRLQFLAVALEIVLSPASGGPAVASLAPSARSDRLDAMLAARQDELRRFEGDPS